MDDLRATLSALMGSITEENSLKGVDFTDDIICKLYLTGLCPHDLFANTKHYMGPCPKKHSDELKEKYTEARKKKRYYYEEDAIRIIQPLVDDSDKKISRGQVRCDEEASEMRQQNQLKLEEIHKITKEVDELMLEVEKLGNEGKIDDSIKVDEEVQKLNEKKAKLEEERVEAENNFSQNLKPCEICGALLSAKDSDRRLSEHFSGKIHIGFQMLRTALTELKSYIQSAPLNDATRESTPREYNRNEHYSHHKRDRSTHYEVERKRDRRERHRSIERVSYRRSRDRYHHRDRSRDRGGERSRDRSRDRERERSSRKSIDKGFERSTKEKHRSHKERHREDRDRNSSRERIISSNSWGGYNYKNSSSNNYNNRDMSDKRPRNTNTDYNDDSSEGEKKHNKKHEHRRYRSNDKSYTKLGGHFNDIDDENEDQHHQQEQEKNSHTMGRKFDKEMNGYIYKKGVYIDDDYDENLD